MTKTTKQYRTAASMIEDIRKHYLEASQEYDRHVEEARRSGEKLAVIKQILDSWNGNKEGQND